ncbi:MAG: methylmalonyl-CoA mutase [Elusimicrobia bacterium]|nr:methylmalonyl-CoA mutase [Elusimicrobiota bacterium]
MMECRSIPQTLSGLPVDSVYGPPDNGEGAGRYESQIGDPGHFPFTRGISVGGYRSKLWTMRQFCGHGTAGQTNRRLKYLLHHGETGLSVAFDLPTLMGIDSDDRQAEGEVGKEGVAIDTLRDFEILFDGIELKNVSTSMTINLPAVTLFSMYLKIAEKQGAPWNRIRGTCQTDILKEFIAQNEYLYPPEPSIRLVCDLIAFAADNVPRYFPVSISGYHIREAGASAVEELAFTLANGREYVRRMAGRGYDPDRVARHLSFFFDIHNYFFEEIAKLRAGRRLWAKFMKDEAGAKRETSWLLPMHCQTAGVSLTAQQPLNNIVRTTYQAMAAVLGGTQSLHTNSYDEALCLPTEEAVRTALRTQQIIAHESGLADTVDPFGGSYYLERLTDQMEDEAMKIIREIESMGGIVPALNRGYFHRRIAESAYRYEVEMAEGKRRVAGVNAYAVDVKRPKILKISSNVERSQKASLTRVKKERDQAKAAEALERLRQAASDDKTNVIPFVLEAVSAYASVGEITRAFQDVFGTYRMTQ